VPHAENNTRRHSDLDRFLFADVGMEASGMTLSVLSMIARRGCDPWAEAARLTTLPSLAAVDWLARTIAAMPASPWSLSDATASATRLVALLPAVGVPDPDPTARLSSGPLQMTFGRALIMAALAVAVGAATLSLGEQRDSAQEIQAFPPTLGEVQNPS
jgi:hypothetical protein